MTAVFKVGYSVHRTIVGGLLYPIDRLRGTKHPSWEQFVSSRFATNPEGGGGERGKNQNGVSSPFVLRRDSVQQSKCRIVGIEDGRPYSSPMTIEEAQRLLLELTGERSGHGLNWWWRETHK